jgi:hypothetical protein
MERLGYFPPASEPSGRGGGDGQLLGRDPGADVPKRGDQPGRVERLAGPGELIGDAGCRHGAMVTGICISVNTMIDMYIDTCNVVTDELPSDSEVGQ